VFREEFEHGVGGDRVLRAGRDHRGPNRGVAGTITVPGDAAARAAVAQRSVMAAVVFAFATRIRIGLSVAQHRRRRRDGSARCARGDGRPRQPRGPDEEGVEREDVAGAEIERERQRGAIEGGGERRGGLGRQGRVVQRPE
jgi:hypothetical protein